MGQEKPEWESDKDDTLQPYPQKLDEISSQIIDDTFAPPWLKETAHLKKPAPFHFSRLQRKQDIAMQKKRRKRGGARRLNEENTNKYDC
jgi:hypothetical protein